MKARYSVKGVVIEGRSRGKTLGFPTANIKLAKEIPEGIYASKVIINSDEFLAAAFVGIAKTFNETNYQLEVYILDFNQDIYDKEVKIKLYNKIRENRKFQTAEELVTQMKKDVELVKEYFKKHE